MELFEALVWIVKWPINNIRIRSQIEAHSHLWRCSVVSNATSHPMQWNEKLNMVEHAVWQLGLLTVTATTHLTYILCTQICIFSRLTFAKQATLTHWHTKIHPIPDIQNTGLRYLLSMAAASGWRPMTDSECNDDASLHWGSTIQSWIDDEDWRCRLEYLVSLPYNDGHITSPSQTPRPPLLRWTPCLAWSPGRPTPGLIAHYNWFFRPNLGDVVVTLILIWWVVNL